MANNAMMTDSIICLLVTCKKRSTSEFRCLILVSRYWMLALRNDDPGACILVPEALILVPLTFGLKTQPPSPLIKGQFTLCLYAFSFSNLKSTFRIQKLLSGDAGN